ncbi:hypothetical protein TWF730_009123 [Orbilia blumenaviensis]|uniref:Uncharacterized protein n=1 Tax=Orbilia blumenaviensis TaxID=1796055 RepID=A0AAV9UXM7_9PEZI
MNNITTEDRKGKGRAPSNDAPPSKRARFQPKNSTPSSGGGSAGVLRAPSSVLVAANSIPVSSSFIAAATPADVLAAARAEKKRVPWGWETTVETFSAAIPPAAPPVQNPSQPAAANPSNQFRKTTDKPVIALQVVRQVPQQQPIFPTVVVATDKDEGGLPEAPPYTNIHIAVDREIDMQDTPIDHFDHDEDVYMLDAPALRGYGGRYVKLSNNHAQFMQAKRTFGKRKMTINLKDNSLFPKFCRNFTDAQIKIDQGYVYLVGRSMYKWRAMQ